MNGEKDWDGGNVSRGTEKNSLGNKELIGTETKMYCMYYIHTDRYIHTYATTLLQGLCITLRDCVMLLRVKRIASFAVCSRGTSARHAHSL